MKLKFDYNCHFGQVYVSLPSLISSIKNNLTNIELTDEQILCLVDLTKSLEKENKELCEHFRLT